MVENLSKSTFKDLLDDLLQDKVLSDAERDEILETTPVTKDRARNLVDVVKRKGEQAVSCFLVHLEKRDENLYKNLPEPPKGKSTQKPTGECDILEVQLTHGQHQQMTKKYTCEVFIGGLIYVVLCFGLSR